MEDNRVYNPLDCSLGLDHLWKRSLTMDHRPYNPPDGSLDIARSTRDTPPAHYTLMIESFTQLMQSVSDTGTEKYESEIFEASGYKWKLSLYPNGDKARNGDGHISLYLVIAETESLPVGWEVKVNLKLFVFDHVHDTYLIIQDNDEKIRHFHEFKRESGFAKLLPLSVFKDPANGFLTRDRCTFGVEVFVLNYSGRGEYITLSEKVDAVHTWKIDNFSTLQKERGYSSGDFTLGNRTWEIVICPTAGDVRPKGELISLFLKLSDTLIKGKAYVLYKIRVMDQLHGKHKEKICRCCLTESFLGKSQFLSMNDLNNQAMGFLVKDTMIIEVEITSMSSVKKFS